MNLADYLYNPCRASSLPYRKAKSITPPPNLRIVHDEDFRREDWSDWSDEPYFRLIHDLKDLPQPGSFPISAATPEELCEHIRLCYDDLRATPDQLAVDEKFRIAIRMNGCVVASGVADLDEEIGEGTLEWIQVSRSYRGKGLGRAIVSELLRRLSMYANFVTVSGKIHNPTCPQQLYRSCGFVGNDIWHILTKPGKSRTIEEKIEEDLP